MLIRNYYDRNNFHTAHTTWSYKNKNRIPEVDVLENTTHFHIHAQLILLHSSVNLVNIQR